MPASTLTQEQRERRAIYIKAWRAKNKDHVKEYSESYNAAHPSRNKESSLRYYYTKVKSDPQKLAIKNAKSKAYDVDHPEKVKGRIDRYKQKNRELLAAKAKAAYHAKSPEQRKADRDARKEYYKRWSVENKQRVSQQRREKYDSAANYAAYRKRYQVKRVEYIQRANARQRLLVGRGEFTQQDIDRLYEQQAGKCTACHISLAEGYEIDHVMPISLGGSNTADNLQLLCMPCNRRKHNMHPSDWSLKIKSA